MKKIFLTIILIIIVLGVYFLFRNFQKEEPKLNPNTYEIQGVKIEILKEGAGIEAKNGDMVTVNYLGTLGDGTKFDSSYDRGMPFVFSLGTGQMIKGWDLGVLGMKVGEKRKLTIPSDLAYGASGVGKIIPPKATLIFEVELLGVNQ